MKKASRTISGVTPVAVMARPMGCPGKCIYCPTYSSAPQSYTPESPAVQRARLCDYHAKKQVELRLKVLAEMGHPTDKVELIVMGGTFLAAPEEYQYQFIKDCYDALNNTPSQNLEEAKHLNETAVNRCVGLCIETRPDWCETSHILRMLDFGTTRVEIGVQMLDDEVYRIVNRGHTVEDVVAATYRLKTYGFKVHYHWMPGLPGSSPRKDLELTRVIFNDERFRPDGLKIYPTMIIEGTKLERWFKEEQYLPYDNEVMTGLVADIKAVVPKYVRISRVLRDIPPQYIVGGLKDSLRDGVKERLAQTGKSCRCIRCREFGHRTREGWETGEPELVRFDYDASGSREIFLSFEDNNETLFGLLRLRVQTVTETQHRVPQAIVRELHIYGPEVPLSSHSSMAVQHRGLGHTLLAEAERITSKEFQIHELAILSGIGARQYYAESGYQRVGAYMVKII